MLTSQAIEPKLQTLQAAPREETSASVVRNARRDTASASERKSQCSNYTEFCSVLKCFGMTGQPLAAKSLAVSACGNVMRITLQPDGHNITCSKIPAKAKAVACSAYTDSRYYWGAITLLFRLVMTILQATVREFPQWLLSLIHIWRCRRAI